MLKEKRKPSQHGCGANIGEGPKRSDSNFSNRRRRFEVGETSSNRSDEGGQEAITSCRRVTAWSGVGKGKKISKRIVWGDEVGGNLLKFSKGNEEVEGILPASGKDNTRDRKETFYDDLDRSKSRGSPGALRGGVTGRGEDGSTYCSSLNKGSFKDVLMRRSPLIYPAPNPQQSNLHAPPSQSSRGCSRGRNPPHRPAKRCFRCLASDHLVATCRDPVRCFRCKKTGHRAHFCIRKAGAIAGRMNRAANLRGRPPRAKVFVPYTDEYLRRVELRRNAILADVIQPANLGPDPISTIKTALASRFAGYKEDFAVARYRERDFAIFLPEWVPAAVLIRREVLTLNDFWIRCWPWGRNRDARPHRVQYKAWIRLINLPFEIWTVARVAALISGFGRFIKADEETKAMTNFRAFRCQIALDSIYNIPQNLSVIIGEELFPVMVHLERWERIVEGGAAAPPAPPPAPPENGGDNAHEEGNNQNQPQRDDRGEAFDHEDEDMEDAPGELEEVDPHLHTHRALWVSSATRASHRTGSALMLQGTCGRRRTPSSAHQTGSVATLCVTGGRRCWVATGRRGSDFDATGALGSRLVKTWSNVASGQSMPSLPSLPVPIASGGQLAFLPKCQARESETPEAVFAPLGQLSSPEPIKLGQLSSPEPIKLFLASCCSPFILSVQIPLDGSQVGLSLLLVSGPTLHFSAWPTSPSCLARWVVRTGSQALGPTRPPGPDHRGVLLWTHGGATGSASIPAQTLLFGGVGGATPDFGPTPAHEQLEVVTPLSEAIFDPPSLGPSLSATTFGLPAPSPPPSIGNEANLVIAPCLMFDPETDLVAHGANQNAADTTGCTKRGSAPGALVLSRKYSLTLHLTQLASGKSFFITNVYGPPTWEGKEEFCSELLSLCSSCPSEWVICGDFNFTKSQSERKGKPWSSKAMTMFSDLINKLAVMDLPLSNQNFTWSNMQQRPTLAKLDRFLISTEWDQSFPFSKRADLKSNLLQILEEEEILWNTRAKQRWLKEGDGNTKFFHAFANGRKRSNTIVAIEDDSGQQITNEELKRSYFYQSFKQLFLDARRVRLAHSKR
ncbi:hypothetical protein ACMD2_16588 [Ananas comosus]|uniref:CCHC-type domain-containing protein n=1 Tax=Ananas comosus TaxID=4615 RepID=A0A199UKJ8_ANACO|nr:hypothetical protein ACMD2_16588 [Ananas comosus]